MRAINHALTGSIIGLSVGQPAIAIPAALASHFICDIIPHYASSYDKSNLRRREPIPLLVVDALLCAVLVAVLALGRPLHWQLAAICAFLAASPDLLWFRPYLAEMRHKAWQLSAFDTFADRIQWFQRPIGWVVEVAWFMAGIIILVPFLG